METIVYPYIEKNIVESNALDALRDCESGRGFSLEKVFAVCFDNSMLVQSNEAIRNSHSNIFQYFQKLSIVCEIFGLSISEIMMLDVTFLAWFSRCPDKNKVPFNKALDYQIAWEYVNLHLEEHNQIFGDSKKISSIAELKESYNKLH